MNSAEFSPAGNLIVTASHDGSARVWNAETGVPASPNLLHDGPVYYATFSPNGRWVVTAGHDGAGRVWDVDTGGPVTPPLRHLTPVFFAGFTADHLGVLTVSYDGVARNWSFPAKQRTVEDLTLLTDLLFGRKSDAARGFTRLGTAEIQRAWHILRARYPDDFQVHAEELAAWRGHR